MSPAIFTVLLDGRSGERVSVTREVTTGRLVGVALVKPDGSTQPLARIPNWVRAGLHHDKCVREHLAGRPGCSRCLPSLHVIAARARALQSNAAPPQESTP